MNNINNNVVQCKTVAGENFGKLVTLRIWWGKNLANCNELTLSCLIKTRY